MSDKLHPSSIEVLISSIFQEKTLKNEIFGIPVSFIKRIESVISPKVFDKQLESPIGLAAGPHTQLAQNIVSGWLCGARYMELKTIQTLDELELAKPCIDMQDEGYNCEWSQELKVEQSFDQYLNAWIIIHILNYTLFGKDKLEGTLFNMSVGYDYQGILKENVQWFLAKMDNCSKELEEKINEIRPVFADIDKINIPARISDNITLSTMHGCPPDEIEKIAGYLLSEKKLHTYVKLNPTLLGPAELREILNVKCNFDTTVPDEAFEHDLKYNDAVGMIQRLQQIALSHNLEFGLKLTNTLESINHKKIFPDDVNMMYMSGRALHPIAVNVAKKLQNEFDGKLNLSFSGGADAFNIEHLVKSGFKTITVSSDLLKPGGYTRLFQYHDNLAKLLNEPNKGFTAESFSDKKQTLEYLNAYAKIVLEDERYKNKQFVTPTIKGKRKLDYFDCIQAPCVENCATHQDIPNYLYATANNNYNEALQTILKTNPLPAITGNICDHLCQLRCTRINYDEPLQVREIKRFVEENHTLENQLAAKKRKECKVAIIGAGPAGLSAAYYLRKHGLIVEVFEEKEKSGGMVSGVLPSFRLSDDKIAKDVERIKQLGVTIHYKSTVNNDLFNQLNEDFNYIFIATGAKLSAKLDIPGINSKGVIEPLNFLEKVRQGLTPEIGKNICIIGGGNTAMDTARVAKRLVGPEGKVTVLYRRRIKDMPADMGEIQAVIEEGVEIIEKMQPLEVATKNGTAIGLNVGEVELKTNKGRPKPVLIPGKTAMLPFDMIIPAVGQKVLIDFLPGEEFKPHPNTFELKLKNVFTGGDALRGASTAINAIADGRKVAETILKREGVQVSEIPNMEKDLPFTELMKLRAVKQYAEKPQVLSLDDRINFKPVSSTLDKKKAQKEAARCLQCDMLCNVCVSVCPNRANVYFQQKSLSYQLKRAVLENETVVLKSDKTFKINQSYQIINVADYCNECGNCNTFCPTAEAPYLKKPRFYLSVNSLNEAGEGFYFSQLPQKNILIQKEQGGIRTIEKTNGKWVYETDHVKATFNQQGFELEEAIFKVPCAQQAYFTVAAEMSVLYEAAEQIFPG